MWVFGYGSLVWNPGFTFQDSKIGFVKGYTRRFWQGNDVHRGTPDKPGRVATIIQDGEGITWGRAFQLIEDDSASSLAYLESRESKLGGYTAAFVEFQPRDPKEDPFPVLLYIAQSTNRLFLGPAPLPQVATEIADAEGICGHNAEYLIRLATFMRDHVPNAWDEHLFTLEQLVRSRLKEKKALTEFLLDASQENGSGQSPPRDLHDRPYGDRSPPRSVEFASLVPSRKLRCLDL